MKRIFVVLTIVMLIMAFLSSTCYAMEDSPVVQEGEETDGDVVGGGDDTVPQDWLTDLRDAIRANKDDIAALCIILAGALFEAGVIYFKKKIWPAIDKFIKQQSEKAMEMAKASGQITQANKKQFEEVLQEVRAILTDGSERERVLLNAMETEAKTKEEYKDLCIQLMTQNKVMVTALMAQEQMTYETLMSAKLTDVRKEEIEKQHLQFKSAFEVASNPIPEAVNKDEVVEA